MNIKSFLQKVFRRFGYEINKLPYFHGSYDPYTRIKIKSRTDVIDLDALAEISLSIPGMITPISGQFLYALCYMQTLKGDVVEIGSWQGRSSSFLARAVKNSKNGKFYAIDHFKGNIGKESFYRVGKEDLSDLKSNFLNNMDRLDLLDTVNLLDMPNEEAVKEIGSENIRFLFIDGDHTKAGVEKDIELFFPLLSQGSIVVFDDFAPESEGLIEAIDNLLYTSKFQRIMSYARTLILMAE